ncbi:MAG: cell division protein SepF [Firmicutes bacterium]|jgi:cell division inhibitor SepF|nr:cell division protein SepF [Bacillota bacterium]NLO65881.1 cell division protein SepF [Bacillota bacterium]
MSDFVHKLKVFLGVAEDFDEEEVVEVPRRQQDEDVVPFRRERTKKQGGEVRSSSKPALVGLSGGQTVQSTMLIMEPRAFEDVKEYVVQLKNRKSLILRLHLVSKAEAQRIVDFMSGTTYALDGNLRKLGETIFCFTPASVAIEGDLEHDFFEMIKDKGE